MQWERALGLLEEMGRKRVELDSITYNAAISACSKGGQRERALEVLEEMEHKGVECSTITYSTVMRRAGSGSGHWGC